MPNSAKRVLLLQTLAVALLLILQLSQIPQVALALLVSHQAALLLPNTVVVTGTTSCGLPTIKFRLVAHPMELRTSEHVNFDKHSLQFLI